jgi:hypothetical protein
MFVQNQKVILPKSHGEKEGVIVLIPKVVREQSGLTQTKGRVKVSYMTVGGGATEAWFQMDTLQAWRKPADITAELNAKHQKEMEAVNAEKDKLKLDWIQSQEEKDVKKDKQGQDVVDETIKEIIVPDKNTDIIGEMKKAENKVIEATQPIVKKTDDNSDSYGG